MRLLLKLTWFVHPYILAASQITKKNLCLRIHINDRGGTLIHFLTSDILMTGLYDNDGGGEVCATMIIHTIRQIKEILFKSQIPSNMLLGILKLRNKFKKNFFSKIRHRVSNIYIAVQI